MQEPGLKTAIAGAAGLYARRDSVDVVDAPDLVTHLRRVAAALPERAAVTYLERGEVPGRSISFAALDARARSLASRLQRQDVAGARAILLFDACTELVEAFFGCAYAGVIAVPMPAPSSGVLNRYLLRIKDVIVDCGARFVLTTAATREQLFRITADIEGFAGIAWIAVDEVNDAPEAWRRPLIHGEDLIYLQYTSGSTSSPKGVMITHRNMMSVIGYNGLATGCRERGLSTLCWMPFFHDFGLIDGIMVPLAHGMSVYLMSPFDFVQQPSRWVKAISALRITHSAGPSFSFDLVARKTTDAERRTLDLSCWKRANNTAEPIRGNHMTRFFDAFEPAGFDPMAMAPAYAMAETTLSSTLSTGGVRYYPVSADALAKHQATTAQDGETMRLLAGCGRVWLGPWSVKVRIVDPTTRRALADGEVGEIWMHGDLVAAGYWQKPELTAERFQARITDGDDAPYMRSGDLGFMLDGELVVTGRLKDLIIVEGRNHYPQDIESCAERSHPGLRPGCSIAFAIDDGESSRVVLVCEIGKEYRVEGDECGEGEWIDRAALERGIRREVSEAHQLRVHEIVLLPAGVLPKTTSGKVERSYCKVRYLEGSLQQGVVRL